MRWCWVSFQCRGVLLIWRSEGQGPTALAVGAGGGCLDIFSLVYHFSFLSPALWETARYRLKYCLKGSLSPKQPTKQRTFFIRYIDGQKFSIFAPFQQQNGHIPRMPQSCITSQTKELFEGYLYMLKHFIFLYDKNGPGIDKRSRVS